MTLHLHFLYPDGLHEEHCKKYSGDDAEGYEEIEFGDIFTPDDGEEMREYIVDRPPYVLSVDTGIDAWETHVTLIPRGRQH